MTNNVYQKPRVRMMYQDYLIVRDILEDLDDRTERETALLEKIWFIIRAIERNDRRGSSLPAGEERLT
jgi:hypothetical protein